MRKARLATMSPMETNVPPPARGASDAPPGAIPGYRVGERLHETARAVICRGTRVRDGRPVILKLLYGRMLTAENIACCEHEYKILQRLQSPGVVRACDFVRAPATVALVTEDFDGRSLNELIATQSATLTLGKKIGLAHKLVTALRDVHAANIIHKDINPNNVVVNLETEEVKLIDFGLATLLPREQTAAVIPALLLGTLPYIAPEQTGRMNRAVDYRSDFYSLGATLYELFTGQPPFTAADPLELIHAHIARAPAAPHQVNPEVPEAVSAIVLKLLAKTAEDRYQSLWSLAADLDRCLKEWRANSAIAPFAIDQLKVRDRFQLPQQLYGRDRELQALRDTIERAGAGKPEALFVIGRAGVGKTSLVCETYQAVAAGNGRLVTGTFDSFQHNVPYGALLSALRELLRELLSTEETSIAAWRDRLRQALGPNARVLVELLPELELIVGETPAVPALAPAETEARLVDVMRRFFRAVCQPRQPLVLFLNDLQYADAASAGMLRHLLTDAELTGFLFVGCYRDDEVDAAHPLTPLREQLARDRVAQTEIKLAPLAREDIAHLVSDMFGLAPHEVDDLAGAVLEKTGGNPQFVAEFLKSLHAKNLLHFDAAERRWRWDIALIKTQHVTDNVVELMTASIHRLDEALQRRLRLAACIGTSFDLGMLAAIAGESARQLATALQAAVADGVIVPEGANPRWLDTDTVGGARFHFAHGRLQHALYQQIPDAERSQTHHRIGRQLLARLAQDASSQNLFEAVGHLNRGRSDASAPQRTELARLNLRAGNDSKTSAVYAAALDYFKTGIELLGADGWDEHYDLALALHHAAAEVAPLCDQYPELERCFAQVRAHGRSALDKIPIYETKLAIDIRRMDTDAATDTGLEALRLLGVRLPAKPGALDVLYYTARAKFALWGRTPESLVDHPRMRDPARIAESRLLVRLCQLFYRTNRALLILALYRFVYICVRYGNSDAAPTVYSNYAMTLCAGKEAEQGHRFGRLALALLEKFDARDQRPWVTAMVHGNVEHWKEHARHSLPALLECHRQAMDIGNMPAAGVSLVYHGFMSYHVGEPLPLVHALLQSHIDVLTKTLKDKLNARVLALYRDISAYLMGTAGTDGWYTTTDETSETYVKTEQGQPYTFHFFRGILAYHFGDYERAYRYLQRAMRHAHSIIGALRYGDMYDGLSRIMIHPRLPKEEQKKNREAILRIKGRLNIFAKDGPDNYLHCWHLLEAEFARLEGKDLVAAMERYDQAIDTARLTGHVHEEALANELAARYYLGSGKVKIAQAYMTEARALYDRWGAARKTQWLDETFPQLRAAIPTHRVATVHSTSHSRTTASGGFELPALMKALRTIAEKTVYSQILQETMQIVMQFAGAEKALLLLRDAADVLQIEADADITRAEPELMKSIPLEQSERLCHAVANYTRRTKTSVVIPDATAPQPLLPGLANDPYVRANGVKSILCLPITSGAGHDAELIGLLYVENNRSSYAFTEQRVETLELICLSLAGRLELSRKAVTDSLTGLYNRGYFQSTLTKEFSAARRKERPLALVLVDIDHFKKVNDQWGHQIGDEVLKHVAKVLKNGCRESDVAARYGGEEMVLILPETNLEQALEVAERIRCTLAEHPYADNGLTVPATASLGVTALDVRHGSAEAMIKDADEALYRSKENGRNRVTAA